MPDINGYDPYVVLSTLAFKITPEQAAKLSQQELDYVMRLNDPQLAQNYLSRCVAAQDVVSSGSDHYIHTHSDPGNSVPDQMGWYMDNLGKY